MDLQNSSQSVFSTNGEVLFTSELFQMIRHSIYQQPCENRLICKFTSKVQYSYKLHTEVHRQNDVVLIDLTLLYKCDSVTLYDNTFSMKIM